jgi:hypothetical protein
VDLTNYDAVFWNLGDESTADETFNNVEQNFVKIYLQQGGNCLFPVPKLPGIWII